MTKNEKEHEKSDVAKREEEILKFWEENNIFQKSEDKDSSKGEFVFYDGPPFATGLPHYGHLIQGAIKDTIPRYKTMQGYRVRRKWGWDCHGLPLENIIEKKLGLKTKKDIEEIGIETFNEAARGEVLRYADEWEVIVKRMGRWVHMNDDYKTMDASYTESVWWVFSELTKKGLVTEGFKAMHLCPRCGTTLSNFEVAQGYKDIKDFSVTVKLELVDEKNTFLLAWTTTPWTLPGNMAAAVHKDETYVSAELEDGSTVILGRERVEEVLKDKPHNIVREFKGKSLIGKSYKPPFSYYIKEEFKNKENAWKVWHADYVTQEDGTGLVHIAPAFGGDDMALAQEHEIPIVHHVDVSGAFVDVVTDLKGLLVKPKDDKSSGIDHTDTDVEIIKKLAYDGKLFHKEKIEHSYPHCWRCDTPLLNYASSSWFFTVPDLKEKLISENQKIGWVPQDIRDGRFGKWLEGVRDWAISRSRYWGAPIPVWKTDKGEVFTIGSVEDLKKYVSVSGNTYHIIRHGESELNTKDILNAKLGVENALTDKGVEQVHLSSKILKNAKIDLIFHSPLQRTRETAEIIREDLGLEKKQMTMEGRLKEIAFGIFEGKKRTEYLNFFKTGRDRADLTPEGGENWNDVRKRVGEFMYEIENEYKDKNILIVAHNGVHQMLQAAVFGLSEDETGKKVEEDSLDLENAEVRTIDFTPIPHNRNYELDLHRPYIDEIALRKPALKVGEGGEKLTRIPEVFDCWFESGSMPYGQFHYPFENLEEFDPKKDKGYPADFIAEAIDQTRGWFYSMIVLGVALFGKSPYKNVITSGFVLASDGKKMSKSLQNYPDPMEVADKYGVDSLRFYMLSSPVMRGEDLSFSEKGVQEVMRKNIGRLNNVLSFYSLYSSEIEHEASADSKHVLDRWIVSRLNEVIDEITNSMEQYELDRATRPIGSFIDDLSTWYLRRSRDRFKGEDEKDKVAALATTKYVLREISKTMAPFIPFYAEYLYKQICEDEEMESVHLDEWPKGGKIDTEALSDMETTRQIVSLGLEERDKANVKVRQPLQRLSVRDVDKQVTTDFLELIKDEVNVKEVVFDEALGSPMELILELTPELISEGNYRELLRHIQALRKKEKLNPSDEVILKVETNEIGISLIEKWKNDLSKIAGLKDILFVDSLGVEELVVGESVFRVELVK